MNAPLRLSYPPEVNLTTRLDVTQLAESVAIQERQRLGLGDQPVINLRSTLEWAYGINDDGDIVGFMHIPRPISEQRGFLLRRNDTN